MKILIKIIGLIIGLIAVINLAFCILPFIVIPACIITSIVPANEQSRTKAILHHLENQYHEEFIIKQISSYKGDKKSFNAIVSPKDNKSLEFTVSYCKGYYQPWRSLSDNYKGVNELANIKHKADKYCVEHFGEPISEEVLNNVYIYQNELHIYKKVTISQGNLNNISDEISQLINLVRQVKPDMKFEFNFMSENSKDDLRSRYSDIILHINENNVNIAKETIKNKILERNPFLMQYRVVNSNKSYNLNYIVDGNLGTSWAYDSDEITTINDKIPYVEIELEEEREISRVKLQMDLDSFDEYDNVKIGFEKILFDTFEGTHAEAYFGKNNIVKIHDSHNEIIIEKILDKPLKTKHFKFKLDNFYFDKLLTRGTLRIYDVFLY